MYSSLSSNQQVSTFSKGKRLKYKIMMAQEEKILKKNQNKMFTLIKSFVSFQNLHVAQQQEESCFALTQEDNWETFESSSARKQ